MKFFLNLSVFILGIGNMIPAQSQIRTVQCYPVGSPFAEPVIELGSGQQLFFSFDDLSSETNSYTYKIVHCDPDWNNSNLSSFTYLTGFFSNPLDNYEYSFNTVVPYTRFTLNLPNEEVVSNCPGTIYYRYTTIRIRIVRLFHNVLLSWKIRSVSLHLW